MDVGVDVSVVVGVGLGGTAVLVAVGEEGGVRAGLAAAICRGATSGAGPQAASIRKTTRIGKYLKPR